MIIIVELIFRR